MKNNALKTAVALTLFLIAFLILIISWNGASAAQQVSPQQDTLPGEPTLVSGEAIDTRFDRTCYLTDRNGETLSFWAENLGTGDVVLMVNGQAPQTIAAGAVGQVTVPLTYFTRAYHCSAVPAQEGDLLHIQYCLVQGGETA